MRLPHPLGISGPTLLLPDGRQSAQEAVGLELLDPETADELGCDGLPVADQAPPEMAVEAGRRALTAAGVDAAAGDRAAAAAVVAAASDRSGRRPSGWPPRRAQRRAPVHGPQS